MLHEGVGEKQCSSGSGLYTPSPLMVVSQKPYLFQAATWHPKKNALVDAASDLSVESTVKLSAQDRQWCHSLERKYTAKGTIFLCDCTRSCFPERVILADLWDVFSALLSVISLASCYGLCSEILKILRLLVPNSTASH